MDIIINAASESTPSGSKSLPGAGDWLANFLLCAGFDPLYMPLADLLRQLYQLEGEWIIMEPIHWEASHNDAMIVARGPDLHLTDAEARSFFEETARFLGEDGFLMHYHDAHTWLINIDGKPLIKNIPTHCMLHKSMMPALRSMDESMYWQRVLTELQMFLSTHPCNARRAGLLPVNGLWMYGGGKFTIDTRVSVRTDDERFMAAFPSGFRALSYEEPITSSTTMLINDSKNTDQLLTLTEKYNVRWYWNNRAYLTGKINLWNRIMRGCRNACQTKETS